MDDNEKLIKQIEEYQQIDIEMKVGHCPECDSTFITNIKNLTTEKIVCSNCKKMVQLTEKDVLTLQEFKELLQAQMDR